MSTESAPAPVKLPIDLVQRADALIEAVAARPELMNYARPTRTAVIRLALQRGFGVLSAELAAGRAS